MTDTNNDNGDKNKKAILELKDGDIYHWPESDYGKAEILKKGNVYLLFEIPSFGGEPIFISHYYLTMTSIDELIKTVESWT